MSLTSYRLMAERDQLRKEQTDKLMQRIVELQDQVLNYQERLIDLQSEVLDLRAKLALGKMGQ